MTNNDAKLLIREILLMESYLAKWEKAFLGRISHLANSGIPLISLQSLTLKNIYYRLTEIKKTAGV